MTLIGGGSAALEGADHNKVPPIPTLEPKSRTARNLAAPRMDLRSLNILKLP
jgi:hypothetical protein